MASGPRRPFRTLVLLAVLLVVGVPGGVWAWFAVDGGPLDGMLVEGVVLRAGDDPEEIVRRHADAWLETQLTVDAGPLVTSATRLQLGARVDIDGALERIRSAGRTGNPLADLRDLGAARDGELDVVLRAYVDRDAALRYLGNLRGRVERSPIPAVIGSDRRVTPGVPGVTLSQLEALSAIEETIRRGGVYIRVPVSQVDPPARAAVRLDRATFVERIGAFETRYSPSLGAGRATNIERAAALLDGTTIPPGGVLSFNAIVGERTEERGFMPAVEIARGRRTEGIGGGICQVAATLHAAAFLGGFEILEHYPHSRNVEYVEAGLDAAVVWGQKDLRVRNPHPYFVRLRATTPGNRLRVELLGPRPGPPVDWTSDILEETEPTEERVVDPALPPGTEAIVDEGEAGVVILRTRTIHTDDGPRYDERTIRYPMVSRLIHVGPGTGQGAPEAQIAPAAEPSAAPESPEPPAEPAAEPAPAPPEASP